MKKTIEESFEEILMEDEKIEKIIKPNKARYFIIQLLIVLSAMLIVSVCGLIELVEYYGFESIWAPIAITVVVGGIYMLFAWRNYCNLGYLITNKRIIKRSGMIGIDFDGVEVSDVAEVSVKKIWYDVWFKKNTGTILMASLLSKNIDDVSDEFGAIFRMSGVDNVNEVADLIKTIIKDSNTKEELNIEEAKKQLEDFKDMIEETKESKSEDKPKKQKKSKK